MASKRPGRESVAPIVCADRLRSKARKEQLGPVLSIVRMVPFRNVLDQLARYPDGPATESPDFLFLLCLVASGTVTFKAKARFTLHLRRVCLPKEGRLREGGKQALPPSPLSMMGVLLLRKPPRLVARLLTDSELTGQSQFQTLLSPAELLTRLVA